MARGPTPEGLPVPQAPLSCRMAVQRPAGGPQPQDLGQKMVGQAWDLLMGSHLASQSLTMAAAVRPPYWLR